jgi:hypothetical protein
MKDINRWHLAHSTALALREIRASYNALVDFDVDSCSYKTGRRYPDVTRAEQGAKEQKGIGKQAQP